MLREGPVKLEALLPTFGAKPGKVGSQLQATFIGAHLLTATTKTLVITTAQLTPLSIHYKT